MSAALAELLVELSEPTKLKRFQKDPEAVMTEANLTEMDRAALISGKAAWIRHQALKPKDEPLPEVPDVTAGPALDVIDTIDVADVVVIA